MRMMRPDTWLGRHGRRLRRLELSARRDLAGTCRAHGRCRNRALARSKPGLDSPGNCAPASHGCRHSHSPVERHYQAYVARVTSPPAVTTLLLHDMTAIRRTEQMRADFVANASHELRTPLAAVSGFIDTLKGHAREDVEARDRFLDIMTVE